MVYCLLLANIRSQKRTERKMQLLRDVDKISSRESCQPLGMFFYLYIKTRLNILNLIQPIGKLILCLMDGM